MMTHRTQLRLYNLPACATGDAGEAAAPSSMPSKEGPELGNQAVGEDKSASSTAEPQAQGVPA